MPSLYAAIELLTRIKDAIIVVLIVYRSCQTITKHAFSQGGQRIDWVVAEKGGSRGIVPFSQRAVGIFGRCFELKEFVLGW